MKAVACFITFLLVLSIPLAALPGPEELSGSEIITVKVEGMT